MMVEFHSATCACSYFSADSSAASQACSPHISAVRSRPGEKLLTPLAMWCSSSVESGACPPSATVVFPKLNPTHGHGGGECNDRNASAIVDRNAYASAFGGALSWLVYVACFGVHKPAASGSGLASSGATNLASAATGRSIELHYASVDPVAWKLRRCIHLLAGSYTVAMSTQPLLQTAPGTSLPPLRKPSDAPRQTHCAPHARGAQSLLR